MRLISSGMREARSIPGSRVGIITGASSGIGLGLVKGRITAGYRVVANSRNITASMARQESADLKLVDGDVGILSPLHRLAEIAEVVDATLFLESAPFVNGEILHLDGGAHAGKW
jgi:NAD(P)-dependent dehydrogenase (short-subunit alcohol dehydrogenase family)